MLLEYTYFLNESSVIRTSAFNALQLRIQGQTHLKVKLDVDPFPVCFCSLQDVHRALPGNQQILSHMWRAGAQNQASAQY